MWLRWFCSESSGWRFNLPYSRKAGWSLNIHMWVLPWREDWGHRTAEHSIFRNNSSQRDKWNFMEWPSPAKKISSRAEEIAGRKKKKRHLYFSNRNARWHLGIWQRIVKKSYSQQYTIKRFISLERVILEWNDQCRVWPITNHFWEGRQCDSFHYIKETDATGKEKNDNALGTGKSGFESTGTKSCTKN